MVRLSATIQVSHGGLNDFNEYENGEFQGDLILGSFF